MRQISDTDLKKIVFYVSTHFSIYSLAQIGKALLSLSKRQVSLSFNPNQQQEKGVEAIGSTNTDKDVGGNENKILHEQFLGERRNRWSNRSSQADKRAKFQEQIYIAHIFCESGTDYYKVLSKYPNMTPKTFRCHIEAINNQTVNEIVNYLRYECNVKIERLNRDQKRSMRTQLTKIREWLGNRNLAQLHLYYKFIKRQFDKTIHIEFQPALNLYKTIIQIIRSPYVNVHEAEMYTHKANAYNAFTTRIDTQQRTLPMQEPIHTDQRALIIQYLKSNQLHKVSDMLCQSHGYNIKWSTHAIKQNIKRIIAKTMERIDNWLKQNDKIGYEHLFTQNNITFVSQISKGDFKNKILAYYLQTNDDWTKINQILIKLLYMFAEQHSNQQGIQIPKLQFKQEAQIKTQCEQKQREQNAFYQEQQQIKVQQQI